MLRDDLCPKIFVDTPDEPAAINFFEKHGFNISFFLNDPLSLCFPFPSSYHPFFKKSFKNPVFQAFLSLNLQSRPKEEEGGEVNEKGKQKESINLTVRELEV